MIEKAPKIITPTLHIPVLLDPILSAAIPLEGAWVDGTFGAGGYTRGLFHAGADHVYAIDRDQDVFINADAWVDDYSDCLTQIHGRFGDLDSHLSDLGVEKVEGIVLDIGVSSMQLDQAARGFSFAKDGPLDMRMSHSGVSAADIVNHASESDLADLLFQFGEERASRRIAKKIVAERKIEPFTTTRALARAIQSVMPRQKIGQIHPATRSFQALRIAVNDELGELMRGLIAAEKILSVGGVLAVVTFHSLEDRIVKHFLQARSGYGKGRNRYAPAQAPQQPSFELHNRKAIIATDEEIAQNPRARSAKLRIARRIDAPCLQSDADNLAMLSFDIKRLI